MRKTLTTLTTLFAVLACPVFCCSGGTSAMSHADVAKEEFAPHCRCCRHRSLGADRQREQPSQNDSTPPRDCECQCLCNGAVLDHAEPPMDVIAVDHFAFAGEAPIAVEVLANGDWMKPPPRPAGLCARIALCSLLR